MADCRLALVLAFDVSASVDDREYRLMMQGTATALRDPEVRRAALSGAPVAVAAYVWAGAREQAVAADWLELDEGYRAVPCHAGLYVVPALLAEAETRLAACLADATDPAPLQELAAHYVQLRRRWGL